MAIGNFSSITCAVGKRLTRLSSIVSQPIKVDVVAVVLVVLVVVAIFVLVAVRNL